MTRPNWREADAKLKNACARAATEICALQNQYANCGAGDTDSRSAITHYIWHLLLHPPEEQARDIEVVRLLIVEGKGLRPSITAGAQASSGSFDNRAKTIMIPTRHSEMFDT